MVFLIAILSVFGAFFCFGAWISTDFVDVAWFIGFIGCLFCSVLGASLATLKDTVKKQEERIKKLEEQQKISDLNEKTGD